ncbi:DUF2264 domain-containing protein [Pasteurellaceae bacterium HPA106]|uniref:DUF2264 domain-containing protein n=1 Tax=Spirabiliibacterium pneumoniae TaxID=221400 RepID=UPI001F1CFA8F|nr:DUF2264 domain-containing protein [Spirabiliibacterium pneumoniae]MBE2895315.1 DUF2264 domain-containing protein [Spirabiliibacterium pneumoniae]
MPDNIRYTERPFLAHEHPTWRDYYRTFKQNIRKVFKYKKPFTEYDDALMQAFEDEDYDFANGCITMRDYFIQSFLHHAHFDGAKAYYPGIPAEQGVESDAIESAARSYPLLAAFLHNKNNQNSLLYPKVQAILKTGFLSATNPQSEGFWGELSDYSQVICETADFALALWLSKSAVWVHYTATEQAQIINWLKKISDVKTVDNNWHLFIVLTQLVIRDLSGEDVVNHDRYARIKEFYVGDGWFRDGAKGNFDYYNSWGFHYALFWIDQIDPTFDRTFIVESAKTFCETFKYLFTPQGLTFFGRSIIYRFAAPSALVSSMLQQGQADGQVKRIVATLNRFFIQRGAIQKGVLTQGLFKTDRRLVDSYSGSGSALWSLRTLILLTYGGDDIQLWTTPEQPLEVEKGDFNLTIDAIGLTIIGHKKTGEVCAIFQQNDYPDYPFVNAALVSQSFWQPIAERIVGRAIRPKNNLIRKGVTCYSSRLNLFLNPPTQWR